MYQIPEPTIERLLQLIRVLEILNTPFVTSAELEVRTGWASHTIRKDISFLPNAPSGSSGYDVTALNAAIKNALGLKGRKKFCIVGLGRMGSAYLNFPSFDEEGYELIAGFDSNVNRIEILKSTIPLYPSFKMVEIISRFEIELALLCVPAASAQTATDKMVAAGIKGIVNYAPVVLEVPAGVSVRNVYVVDELRALTATITCLS